MIYMFSIIYEHDIKICWLKHLRSYNYIGLCFRDLFHQLSGILHIPSKKLAISPTHVDPRGENDGQFDTADTGKLERKPGSVCWCPVLSGWWFQPL